MYEAALFICTLPLCCLVRYESKAKQARSLMSSISCSPDSCIAEDNLGIHISDKALQCKTKSWRGLGLSSNNYVHAGNRIILG